MEIEAWAANRLATEMAFILSGGHVDVFDQNGDRLARFEARDFDDTLVLTGSAGHKDDRPAPQMKFRTRMIVQDADVMIDSFVFSVVAQE